MKKLMPLVIVALVSLPAAAFAQEETTFTANYWPVVEWVLGTLAAVAVAVAPILVNKALNVFKEKTGIQVADSTRTYVLAAVNRGVELGIDRSRAMLQEKGIGDIQTKNQIVAMGVNFASQNVGDGLAKLGITQDGLSQMAAAFLAEKLNERGAPTVS